ncbi:MAG: ABC transporter permease [Candidatus Acidiferrales bacterium]
MNWKQIVRERLRLPALNTQREQEIIEDLAQQLDDAYRQALARGADEQQAQIAAASEIADWNRLAQEITESETRNRRGIEERTMSSIENVSARKGAAARMLADFASDVLHALRLLRKSPGFAAVAVLTLALGIGANVALFRVVDALLLQPLPYPEPEQLVQLWLRGIENPENTTIASMPNFIDWRDQSRSFQAMAAFEQFNFNVSGTDEPEQVPGMRVSAAIFDVLGARPRLGRAFTADEEALGKDKVVVISDGLWRRRFGADPSLVGKTIRINGEPRTLVGVMPPGFQFTSPAYGVWVPIAFNQKDQGRGSQSFRVAARIKRGVSLAEAQADIDTVGRRLEKQYPRANEGWTVWAQPFSDFATQHARLILSLLLGASGFVLLIACANIANLFLARGAARQREFAIRLALGAGRGRIARQLLAESFSLALIGGVAGLLASQWLSVLLFQIAPQGLLDLPFRITEASRADSGVLLFALALTLLTALLFGVLPAWKAARTDPNTPLKESGRGVAGGRSRFHNALVVTEIALVMVVVAGSGLMISSVQRLLAENPGFDPRNILTLDIALPQADFYGMPERTSFCTDVERTVGAVPGVATVSAISHLPHTNRNAGRGFVIEGQTLADENNTPGAAYRLVCPNYFRVMGIPLIAGRDFTHADTIGAAEVVIVNEALVRRYFPNEDPLGKRFKLGGPRSTNPWFTIVGVVGDVKHFGLDDRARREMFRPYSQAVWPSMTIIAKTPSAPAAFAPAIRKAASGIDRELPISRVQTMQAWVDATAGPRRFPMQLLSAFGVVGLLLAAMGIYGVMSYGVLQRTHEIGVRMALGAQPPDVARMILREGALLALAGIAIGLLGALWLARLLENLLYGVTASDPVTLATVSLLLAMVALFACWLPARRAMRVDPMIALRHE